ncbi:hypothetical protein NKH77_38255 [Streptomyces sp. M19]
MPLALGSFSAPSGPGFAVAPGADSGPRAEVRLPVDAEEVEVVREDDNLISVYGVPCAHVGETAYRHGIVVHRLSEEIADSGPAAQRPAPPPIPAMPRATPPTPTPPTPTRSRCSPASRCPAPCGRCATRRAAPSAFGPGG